MPKNNPNGDFLEFLIHHRWSKFDLCQVGASKIVRWHNLYYWAWFDLESGLDYTVQVYRLCELKGFMNQRGLSSISVMVKLWVLHWWLYLEWQARSTSEERWQMSAPDLEVYCSSTTNPGVTRSHKVSGQWMKSLMLRESYHHRRSETQTVEAEDNWPSRFFNDWGYSQRYDGLKGSLSGVSGGRIKSLKEIKQYMFLNWRKACRPRRVE